MNYSARLDALQLRYFDPAVLQRYLDRPNDYTVTDNKGDFDGAVQAKSEVRLQIRFDKRILARGGHLIAPLRPEFEELPPDEKSHWEGFEVLNPDLVPLDEDTAFIAAFRQNYLGEFVDWPPSQGN